MNSRGSRFAAIATLLAAAAIGAKTSHYDGAGRTYGDVYKPDTRQLQEFTVKGKKIMAYSKKDAIKRYKHQCK